MITVVYQGRRYAVLSQAPTSDPAVDLCTLTPCSLHGFWNTASKTITVPLQVTW